MLTDAGSALAALRLRSVSSTAVEVPLRYVLGTSAATVRAAPLLLVEALTEQGVVGRPYWTDAIAREPVRIANGCWPMTDRPGSGLDWDADAVQRHRIA